MNKYTLYVFLFTALTLPARSQPVISAADLNFLEGLTMAVLDSSRVHPGQRLVDPFGANNSGGVLIRPGGRDTYPSFWIRDYAMSLETGMVSRQEQRHMLLFTAASQCDQTWITAAGSMVPLGAIPDHVRIDDLLPVFFPGTYDYNAQGGRDFGMFPPYCDQYYFIHMAHYYARETGNVRFLRELVNGMSLVRRLELAFRVPPVRIGSPIVHTTEAFRGVDFGFRDAIYITGDLSYPTILKYQAARQLSSLFKRLRNKHKAAYYQDIASRIRDVFAPSFLNEDGMVVASTEISGQPDVWATALAIYTGLLEEADALKAARHLADAYRKGTLAYRGNIRHIIKGEDFSETTAWESGIVPYNQFQNGAYWGTPVGWVAHAIHLADPGLAARLISEYVAELKESDFRKGPEFQGPYECFYPGGYTRGPVYLTSVSVPYIVLKSWKEETNE